MIEYTKCNETVPVPSRGAGISRRQEGGGGTTFQGHFWIMIGHLLKMKYVVNVPVSKLKWWFQIYGGTGDSTKAATT